MIIAIVIPFALIGVTIGLLSRGKFCGFLALLGAISLAGMMTKNAMVLLDKIDIQKADGKAVGDDPVAGALCVVLFDQS